MTARATYGAAVKRLQNLALALDGVAAGELVREANAKIKAIFEAVAASKLPKHERSGNALATVEVFADAHGIALRQPVYLRYQRRWWPFSRGVPPFLVNKALRSYREALAKRLAEAR